MFGDVKIESLFLKDRQTKNKWLHLLSQHAIGLVTDEEIDSLDQTFGIYDKEELIATISIESNVLKYLVIDENYRETGRLFNLLISHAISILANHGIFHVLVFTKVSYSKSFQYLGFTEIMKTDYGVFLEKGNQSIETYLENLPMINDQEKISAIVMNANPFTKGHLYLVEEASKQSKYVYVFVVSTNKSLFSSDERYQLVCRGVEQLENVIVCPGGDYMVSLATFPSYFIKNKKNVICYQTQLDALIFKEYIAKKLYISKRFLGEEPFSDTTAQYNEALLHYLPPEVAIEIIPRQKTPSHEMISATIVRKKIQLGEIDGLEEFVPKTTYDFIKEHLEVLQKRLMTN